MLQITLLYAILLVSGYHVTTCFSTMSAVLHESQDEDSTMLIPPFRKYDSLIMQQSATDENKGNTDSDDDSNSKIERLLQPDWMQQMLVLVNEERADRGIGPLCFNEKLNKAAQGHSVDMVDNNFFSHIGSDNSTPGIRANRVKYNWRGYGENIAYNSKKTIATSVEATHMIWMNSPGHRSNILNKDFIHMGLGYKINSRGHHHFTQMFGRSTTETCSNNNSSDDDSSDDKSSDDNVCVDSPLTFRIIVNGRRVYKYCAWVASEDTAIRCALKGVSETCLSTCKTCSMCNDSPLRFKVFIKSNKYRAKSCKWTARRYSETRCAIHGMSETCRATCQSC